MVLIGRSGCDPPRLEGAAGLPPDARKRRFGEIAAADPQLGKSA
jgi:hypothetical protein